MQKNNNWVKAVHRHGSYEFEKSVNVMHDMLKWRKDFGVNGNIIKYNVILRFILTLFYNNTCFILKY